MKLKSPMSILYLILNKVTIHTFSNQQCLSSSWWVFFSFVLQTDCKRILDSSWNLIRYVDAFHQYPSICQDIEKHTTVFLYWFLALVSTPRKGVFFAFCGRSYHSIRVIEDNFCFQYQYLGSITLLVSA